MKELARIQKALRAPKGQYNNFAKFNYRSCEDIVEAVKPLLGECIITLNDDIVLVGDRVYVKAIATIKDGEESESAVAFAREPLEKKGMDASQITGTASSYARKYALNGLLLIDDNKDADTMDNSVEEEKPVPVIPEEQFLKGIDYFKKETYSAEDLAKWFDSKNESYKLLSEPETMNIGAHFQGVVEWLDENGKFAKKDSGKLDMDV